MKAINVLDFVGIQNVGGNLSIAASEHDIATRRPNELAQAIGHMIRGWSEYAEAYFHRYGSQIGEDGVLGAEWEAIARGLLGLLDGETGGWDAGSLNANIRDFACENGVNLNG